MTKEIEWLFFDIGSTLVDETIAYENRIREMLRGTGIEYSAFYRSMIGYYKEGKRGDLEAARRWGLQVPDWTSDAETLYLEAYSVLSSLSSRFRIGVIANQPVGTEERLRKFGILGFISVLVSSAEEGVAKPDRRIYEIALRKAKCNPRNAVMIGDRLDNDILPAKQMGMYTVWIKQGFSSYSVNHELSGYADFTISSLGDLVRIFPECCTLVKDSKR